MAGDGHLNVPIGRFESIHTAAEQEHDDNAIRRTRSNSLQSNVSNTVNPVENVWAGTDAVDYARQSSIRLQHYPSRGSLHGGLTPGREQHAGGGYFGLGRRNRSNSVPTRVADATTPGEGSSQQTGRPSYLPEIEETQSAQSKPQNDVPQLSAGNNNDQPASTGHTFKRAKTNMNSRKSRPVSAEYGDQLVDFLDVVGIYMYNLCNLNFTHTPPRS